MTGYDHLVVVDALRVPLCTRAIERHSFVLHTAKLIIHFRMIDGGKRHSVHLQIGTVARQGEHLCPAIPRRLHSVWAAGSIKTHIGTAIENAVIQFDGRHLIPIGRHSFRVERPQADRRDAIVPELHDSALTHGLQCDAAVTDISRMVPERKVFFRRTFVQIFQDGLAGFRRRVVRHENLVGKVRSMSLGIVLAPPHAVHQRDRQPEVAPLDDIDLRLLSVGHTPHHQRGSLLAPVGLLVIRPPATDDPERLRLSFSRLHLQPGIFPVAETHVQLITFRHDETPQFIIHITGKVAGIIITPEP